MFLIMNIIHTQSSKSFPWLQIFSIHSLMSLLAFILTQIFRRLVYILYIFSPIYSSFDCSNYGTSLKKTSMIFMLWNQWIFLPPPHLPQSSTFYIVNYVPFLKYFLPLTYLATFHHLSGHSSSASLYHYYSP